MKELFKEAIEIIANDPDSALKILDSELSLPNIKLPTMGGNVFWTDLANVNGYRLQQNDITKHARILNSDNVRIAWGTVSGMEKALDRLIRFYDKYNKIEFPIE